MKLSREPSREATSNDEVQIAYEQRIVCRDDNVSSVKDLLGGTYKPMEPHMHFFRGFTSLGCLVPKGHSIAGLWVNRKPKD